jgi:hypothetical protein
MAVLMCLLSLSACRIGAFYFEEDGDESASAGAAQDGQEITLQFDFGERTGVYAGEMQDGLPHGHGTFSSSNTDGVGWVYEGGWDMGHMQGEGTTTFETGYKEAGWYENDYLTGEGSIYQDEHLLYEGAFVQNIPDGEGTLYTYSGDVIFSGSFAEGFIDETDEDRRARLALFKEDCGTPDYDALTESATNGDGLRAKATGTVYYVFEPEESDYITSFIVDMQGGSLLCVSYHLSAGETAPAVGKKVTVWGIADCLYTYETDEGAQSTLPTIEAWDVMDVSGTQL